MRKSLRIILKPSHRVSGWWWTLLVGVLCGSSAAFAGPIETTALQQSWPRQRIRSYEVGRHDVRWREAASRKDGIFAGVSFTAPLARPRVWDMANDYSDVGHMTPGVESVRFLENTPTRQVIQIDVKVLWKRIRLTFEGAQDPPTAIRFRLANQAIGEFRGLCLFSEVASPSSGTTAAAQTSVELDTWLKPARPVPVGLLLLVERMNLLQGIKEFLVTCDRQAASSQYSASATSPITSGRP